MSLAEVSPIVEDVPLDRFGVRIAIIRAEKGWNYAQAEAATGVPGQNWRLWERTDRTPQKYEEVCQKIANGSGYNATWIKAGGPLRSRCFSPLTLVSDVPGQMELAFDVSPALELVTT